MKNKFIILVFTIFFAVSCNTATVKEGKNYFGNVAINIDKQNSLDASDDWYRDAVFYHIWVKAFCDSNGDGVGDINGITSKLDYLSDLGISALWLSPIFECDGKPTGPTENMHGYDTVDYYKINDLFGTEDDVVTLLNEAHKRNIRIIFDYVVNHTSNRHSWFLNSRDHGDKYDWYVWTKNPHETETKDVKWSYPWNIGNNPNEWKKVWHQYKGEFYYGPFWAGMPDLNLKNVETRNAMANVLTYWLDKGFDGVRIDAVRYAIEEGPAGAADSKSTHTFFKRMRQDILDKYTGEGYAKMMIGEAWTDQKRILPYYGNGTDEFHSCFDFPLAMSISDAVKNADRDKNGVRIGKLISCLDYNKSNIPNGAINGLFLMNHDEVTSRPMTDYKANIGKVKIATSLGLLLSGMPFVYNGNELGMEDAALKGDMRFRTPIEWDKLPSQQADKESIFNFHKKLIALRNEYESLRRGDYNNVETDEKHTFSFTRSTDNQTMLVVINMDKQPHESVHLNLSNNKIADGDMTSLIGGIAGDKKLDSTNRATWLVGDLEPYEVRVILNEVHK